MLEHHRRMHKQCNSQDDEEMSPDESYFSTPDAAIPGDQASPRLANCLARNQHSTDVNKASGLDPTFDQALGYMADVTVSAPNDHAGSNTTLNALHIKLDRLQREKERVDQEIINVTIALKVVEETT